MYNSRKLGFASMSFSTHFYLSLKSNTYCDKQVFTTFNTLDNYKSKYPHYNSPIDVYIWLTTHSPLLEWPLRNYDWLSSIKEIWPSSINPAFPMLNFDSINRNFVGLNALIKINNALTINSVCVCGRAESACTNFEDLSLRLEWRNWSQIFMQFPFLVFITIMK